MAARDDGSFQIQEPSPGPQRRAAASDRQHKQKCSAVSSMLHRLQELISPSSPGPQRGAAASDRQPKQKCCAVHRTLHRTKKKSPSPGPQRGAAAAGRQPGI
eukprot:1156390-Pelagomonas_calceolata.AAC.5